MHGRGFAAFTGTEQEGNRFIAYIQERFMEEFEKMTTAIPLDLDDR